jgi:hypothetical protein
MTTSSAVSSFPLVHGSTSCHGHSRRGFNLHLSRANNYKPSSALVPRLNPWSSAVASSSTPRPTITPPTNKSPNGWIGTDTPSAHGGNASLHRASPASKTPHAPVAPGAFPPDERLQVVNLASSKTEEHDQPATRWSLDDLAATIVNEAHHRAMSRSTLQRILHAADLKPHRSVYWLNSHDPDFDAKAANICQLYVNALQQHQQGRLVLSSDEKTGMQILGALRRNSEKRQSGEPGQPPSFTILPL